MMLVGVNQLKNKYKHENKTSFFGNIIYNISNHNVVWARYNCKLL